jgi:hypothetical protein
MAAPTSRQTLSDYCLRKLGAPVLEINVDDDQIDDRIDEALQFYREYHSDAVIKTYRKHQVVADDLTNKYVDLPDTFLFCSRVLPLTNMSMGGGMFNAKYQMMLNDIYDLQYAGALVNWEMTRQYLELLDMTLNGVPPVRFNRHMNRLFIDVEWGYSLKVGDWFVVEGYEAIDPTTYTEIYNDMFLKKYTTALIKRQWGENMKKFEGVQLPGGVTMNGQKIWDEAVEEIQKLEEECQLKYEMPPMFFVG